MSIELVMPSNRLIPCNPLLLPFSIFPSIRVFSSELSLHIWWPSIGASVSASVLPMTIWGWFPLGLTGLISLLSKGLSGVFSSTTVWRHQFCGAQPFFIVHLSHVYKPTGKKHSFDYLNLFWQSNISDLNMLSRFVITFLPRSKCLLISWLQSASAGILEPKKIKSVTVSNFILYWVIPK